MDIELKDILFWIVTAIPVLIVFAFIFMEKTSDLDEFYFKHFSQNAIKKRPYYNFVIAFFISLLAILTVGTYKLFYWLPNYEPQSLRWIVSGSFAFFLSYYLVNKITRAVEFEYHFQELEKKQKELDKIINNFTNEYLLESLKEEYEEKASSYAKEEQLRQLGTCSEAPGNQAASRYRYLIRTIDYFREFEIKQKK